MIKKIIKKEHQKIIFSFYGILSMVSMVLPLVMLAFGIYFAISKVNNYGIIWIVVGAIFFLFSLRKLKDFFPIFKYWFKPESFPIYKQLLEDGINFDDYEDEISEANILESLNKNNPIVETENFIFGYSQVSFFMFKKEDLLWIYEYNGNGLVFFDKHKTYGFCTYTTFDGNDHEIEKLQEEMPYLYYGIDFDYKTIMHDDFDNTVIYLEQERLRFLEDPIGYKEQKEKERKEKEEEETRKFEEQKAKQMAMLEEEAKELPPEEEPIEDMGEVIEVVEEPKVVDAIEDSTETEELNEKQ
ncbi:MAG: hypothetical protein K6G38_04725 [Gammaproteobacteria bacterium]|nr:hypothetical protein [Gammaproteobacteria bacterium]